MRKTKKIVIWFFACMYRYNICIIKINPLYENFFFFISRQLSFISYNNNFYDANMTYNENAREKICGLLDHIEMGCCRNEFCGKTIFLLKWFNFEGFYNVDKKTSYERKNHVSTLLKFLYNHSDGAAINIGYRVKLMA